MVMLDPLQAFLRQGKRPDHLIAAQGVLFHDRVLGFGELVGFVQYRFGDGYFADVMEQARDINVLKKTFRELGGTARGHVAGDGHRIFRDASRMSVRISVFGFNGRTQNFDRL